MLTQERLKQLLKYNPDTGEFTNISCRGGAARVGSLAGHYGIYGGKRQVKLHIDRKTYKGSRVAWLYQVGEWPKNRLKFADGNGQNLVWSNLAQRNDPKPTKIPNRRYKVKAKKAKLTDSDKYDEYVSKFFNDDDD